MSESLASRITFFLASLLFTKAKKSTLGETVSCNTRVVRTKTQNPEASSFTASHANNNVHVIGALQYFRAHPKPETIF